MNRILIVFYITLLFSNRASSQTNMPSYLDVTKKFFLTYSHVREDPYDRVYFTKKKEGWYVQVANGQTDSIKSNQLYWDITTKEYKPLNGFSAGISPEEVIKKISEAMQSDDPPFLYGFERCRYFGYNGWDADMIKDFGNNMPENDTLLEGLARAYSFYAGRYTGYVQGGQPLDMDPLKSRLGRLETPGKERMAQFKIYTDKAINCYRLLVKRNPGYRLLVGNAEMKLLNEQFYQYQEYIIYGYPDEATQVLNNVEKNDTYGEIGHAYLDACPPNSVLITFGDNDTYPLWYVQAKEGFRKDVAVINYSMLGTIPYLRMLKKNNTVSFFQTFDFVKKVRPEYFVFEEKADQPAQISLPIANFIDDLLKAKYITTGGIDSLASYQTKTVLFDIDLARLKKICNQNNFTPTINFELGSYLPLSDLAIMDILKNNIYTRPVCLAVRGGNVPEKYLQREGPIYRVLPIDEELTGDKTRLETTKIQDYLSKNYKPVMVAYGKGADQQEMLNGLHSFLFGTLINSYLESKDSVKAKQWAAKYLSMPETKTSSPVLAELTVLEALIKIGYIKDVKPRIEKLASKALDGYINYSATDYYRTKEEVLQILNYLKYLLEQKEITSTIIEEAIKTAENSSDLDK